MRGHRDYNNSSGIAETQLIHCGPNLLVCRSQFFAYPVSKVMKKGICKLCVHLIHRDRVRAKRNWPAISNGLSPYLAAPFSDRIDLIAINGNSLHLNDNPIIDKDGISARSLPIDNQSLTGLSACFGQCRAKLIVNFVNNHGWHI